MLKASLNALPCDIAVCAAAVSDWKPASPEKQKMKKEKQGETLQISFSKNPDILKTLSTHKKRPALMIGFAAETENVLENAAAKRVRKQCDWILANDVSSNDTGFYSDNNHLHLITADRQEDWGHDTKAGLARKLCAEVIAFLDDQA